MKQNKSQHQHDADIDTNNANQSSTKISTDTNTVASSILSYDTTEDLTDTDTSSQDKSSRRKNSSNVNQKKNAKNDLSDSSANVGKVRFAIKSNSTYEVESHENFSAKEKGNYWWSEREKDRMMAKHERLVAKLEQTTRTTKPGTTKKPSLEKNGAYRGLESWTAAGSLKLDYTIEQCISAVMDEQDRQWNENDDDSLVIAKKSLAVTEDSARRARLNGLSDAQEALLVRGEPWSTKNASDEISVGSAISTGTSALVKKKKRSKLLARLDDSHNRKAPKSDSSDTGDVLSSYKKSSRESKKKKKKSSRKSIDDNMSSSSSKTRKKKSKSNDKITEIDQNSYTTISVEHESNRTDQDTSNRRNSAKIQAIIASLRDQGLETSPCAPNVTADDVLSSVTPAGSETVSSFCAGQTAPISPLSTEITPNHSTETGDLLATLRRQQQKLHRSSSVEQSEILESPIHQYRQQSFFDDDDEGEETSDLLETLRRQQKKQALSGGEGEVETAKFSDPPGRRPRRLASRHVGAINRTAVPEESVSKDTKIHRSRSMSNDKYDKKLSGRSSISSKASTDSADCQPTPQSHDMDESKSDFPCSPSGSGKKNLKGLRKGAKTFFKKVAK